MGQRRSRWREMGVALRARGLVYVFLQFRVVELHRRFPGVLSNGASSRLFREHDFMDPFSSDLLHDGYGKAKPPHKYRDRTLIRSVT